jgi:D-aminopeptidase
MRKRIGDYGIEIGEMRKGRLNRISDVAGVSVGHCTVEAGDNRTGVTFVSPSVANPFSRKLPAAVFVLNGFGKSLGLMQVEELGCIETPIFLTNTLNVGLVHDAAVGYMIERCEKEGLDLRSVNPIVMECNDSKLNDIRNRVVGAAEVAAAVGDARADFAEGDVGAGRGMVCHGLKGGIGSASRLFSLDGKDYALGVLALTNHGRLADLTIAGKAIGREIAKKLESDEASASAKAEAAAAAPDKGSVILIFATDAPLSDRQLGRVIRRGSVGLARLGSFIGHGSGEVFLGFSTAYSVSGKAGSGAAAAGNAAGTVSGDILTIPMMREERLDILFRAAAESTEEAVLNSMAAAAPATGPDGYSCASLSSFI